MALGGSSGGAGSKPSASAVKAGEAFFELNADDSPLRKVLQRNVDRFRRFGATIARMGLRSLSIGSGIAAPLALATGVFAEFDDKMRLVGAVSRSTSEELDQLRASAKNLGMETGFTARQVASLMVELGRAFGDELNPKQMEDMTRAVLNLSRATGTDATAAGEILVSTLKSFKLSAEEATRVADALTTADTNTNASVLALGESMSYAGPIAKSLNMSLEETLVIMGALADVGIKGSEAGTALRRLAVIAASQRDAFKAIGVETQDAAGNMRPLVDILADVGRATKDMGTADRAKLFNDLFGLLGITSATALTESIDKLVLLDGKMKEAGGTAERVAKEMDKGIGGSIRFIRAQIESLAISIGEALSPTLMELALELGAFINGLTRFIENNKELVAILGLVTIGLITGGAALSAFGFAMIGIAAAASAVIAVFKTLLIVAFSPFYLKIVAITAVLAGLAYLLSLISGTDMEWGTMFANIGSTFSTTWKGIVDSIKSGDLALAGRIAWVGVKVAGQEVVVFLTKTWAGFKDFFVDAWHDAVFLVSVLLNDLGTGIEKVFIDILAFILSQVDMLMSKLNEMIGQLNALAGALELPQIPLLPRIGQENIENARKRARERAQNRGQATENEINRAAREEEKKRKEFRDRQIKDSQDLLDRLKEELEGLVDQAQKKKEGPGEGVAVAPMPREKKDPVETAMNKLSSKIAGTFQAMNLQQTLAVRSAENIQKKQLNELEKVNANLGKVENAIKNQEPLAFE